MNNITITEQEDAPKKLDKYDVVASISSGALTAGLDALWISDISLLDAHKWGIEETDKFVISVAKLNGYKGKDISDAIRILEKKYVFDSDKATADFGLGFNHHLRDFAHHPTPIGLIFAMLTEFTGYGYGTDPTGKFMRVKIDGFLAKSPIEALYFGTIGWILHLISDVAGSSDTRFASDKFGTGLPGVIGSILKELSAVPGIRGIIGKTESTIVSEKPATYTFSLKCQALFKGTMLKEYDGSGKPIEVPFDLRTELGIIPESLKNKQYIPVILNHIIVAAFYSVRRFVMQIKERQIDSINRLDEIDMSKCFPWKNDTIRHMRMISTATFSMIDLTSSGIRAAVKNGDNTAGFARDFLQGINYWGLGSLALASSSELVNFAGKMKSKFINLAEEQKRKIKEVIAEAGEVSDSAKYVVGAAFIIAGSVTPIGIAAETISVYKELVKSLEELKVAKEERLLIEEECAQRIKFIQENRAEMEMAVSDYLYKRMTIFIQAFNTMDNAITDDDIEAYIAGNNMIQSSLSGNSLFNNMEEFNDLMLSEDSIEL